MEATQEASQSKEPMNQGFIEERIPHRAPFLWLDRILELDETSIRAEKFISEDLDVFQGHYPDYPIMPGVLLCEAIFQAGALLISETMRGKEEINGVPVLTRILGAKFKREVGPGDTIELQATLKERVGPAWFMKGSVRIKGKIAVQVEFACALKAE
ncbi:MAG: 3-hydroxyacyl-ACP dehydratase FabZ [Candidatus Electrothrix aestuarii]|uniref:3-hydroxyacyl-ACP dehydratase FabZ n=1 Tax=Candidatus Electrothrix aestuarii TaxID=3062594 RepID=A0AAU8LX59_9BACT|nr:3-hydroxyacyl-ACP dehydratase FabZ [Candidatus Electrothrix aestuarii]